jgi:hypothetical protein
MADKLVAPGERDAVLEAARELAPALAERAGEGETLGTMPGDLVDKARGPGPLAWPFPARSAGWSSKQTLVTLAEAPIESRTRSPSVQVADHPCKCR